MKWAIDVKAGKNYCEKHVYIPLWLSTDHVTCCCALTNICTLFVSTGSTSHHHHWPATNLNCVTHNDNDNDNDSSSRLETRHVSRYKQQQWWRLPCSRLQRLRKANDDDWRMGVEMRKETECQWNTVSSSQKRNDFLEKCSRFTCCTVISERKKLGVITTI